MFSFTQKVDRGHILVGFSKINIESIWTNKMGLYSILPYKLMPHKNQNVLKITKETIFLCFIHLQTSTVKNKLGLVTISMFRPKQV